MTHFHERLNFDGDFSILLNRVASSLTLGHVTHHDLIEIGFEDCNVKFETNDGIYVAKIFSRHRTQDEITRNIEIIHHVLSAEVNHPPVFYYHNSPLFTEHESGLQMVIMKFISGKTFYDLGRSPDNNELAQIAAQAAKINAINYSPPYLFDSWAIPNMQLLYDKTKNHLDDESHQLVIRTLDIYNSMPFDKLPKCFVHGDLIKSNLIKGDDGNIYPIDFSVANIYPRIQELAVIAANLLADDNQPLRNRVEQITNAYLAAGGELTQLEIDNLFNYSLLASAMEYLGSVNERLKNGGSDEVAFWGKQGMDSLHEAL